MFDSWILDSRENVALVVPRGCPTIEEHNANLRMPTEERIEVVDLHRAALDRRIETAFSMTGVQNVAWTIWPTKEVRLFLS